MITKISYQDQKIIKNDLKSIKNLHAADPENIESVRSSIGTDLNLS